MPTLTFSFDTGAVPLARIVDAFAKQYKYQATILDSMNASIPNPETKTQFARRMVKEYVRDVLKAAESTEAAEAARNAAIAAANITLT